MTFNHIFVSITYNYPHSFNAANTKFGFIGRGLAERDDDVLVINKFYRSGITKEEQGEKDGLKYFSLPDTKFDMITNTLRVCGIIKMNYKKDCRNVVYLGGGHFFVLLLLTLYSRFKGYRVALIWDEYQAGLDFPFIYKINGYLLCYVLGYFVNYILPISEFLKEKSRKFHKPIFKLPICADFDLNNKILIETNNKVSEAYFLYCASVEYTRALDFVLISYKYLVDNHSSNICLHLIISGNNEMIEDLKNDIIEKGLKHKVRVMTQIPYDLLLYEYGHAQGLLIPLFKDRLGDVARFSQKIAEYLSTKRPVLSTNVGEITYYFKNKDTMLISESSSYAEYAELMRFVLDNPEEADKIGVRGFELGDKLFNYRVLTENLIIFLDSNEK